MTGRGILFDVDGVLFDSMAFHRGYLTEWAELRALEFEIVWRAAQGRRWADMVELVAPHLDPLSEAEVIGGLCGDTFDAISMYPSAPELLGNLRPGTWGIVTSSTRGPVTSILSRYGIEPPTVFVDATDVTRGKPFPEGYALGAQRLGLAPADVIAVEDAPDGVTAARDAGLRVLALATTHDVESLTHAHDVHPDLAAAHLDLHAWLAQSDSRI